MDSSTKQAELIGSLQGRDLSAYTQTLEEQNDGIRLFVTEPGLGLRIKARR